DHGVGELHAPERLGADVGARAAAAVNDDGRLGVPDQLGEAEDQRAARDAPGAGERAPRILRGRPRVDDDQVVATLDPLPELVGRELRRLALVQGALAEDFARHVDALDERTPFRAPGGEAAGEDPHVGVTHLTERRQRQRGEPSVLVADDEALRALNHRDFRVFWTGQLVSLIGTWMQSVAQSWLVLQLSGSPLKLGLIGTLQFAPVLLFSVVAGAIADRLPKRRLILATQSAL